MAFYIREIMVLAKTNMSQIKAYYCNGLNFAQMDPNYNGYTISKIIPKCPGKDNELSPKLPYYVIW